MSKKDLIENLANLTEEELEEDKKFKRLKECEPIDLLEALVEADNEDEKVEE